MTSPSLWAYRTLACVTMKVRAVPAENDSGANTAMKRLSLGSAQASLTVAANDEPAAGRYASGSGIPSSIDDPSKPVSTPTASIAP